MPLICVGFLGPFCDAIHELECDFATIADLFIVKLRLGDHLRLWEVNDAELTPQQLASELRAKLVERGRSMWEDKRTSYCDHPVHLLAALLHPRYRMEMAARWLKIPQQERYVRGDAL